MYHLEFDHHDWANLGDTHYERFVDAVAAHDRLVGLPDGATRVVDETGMVHAVLYVPPIEAVPDALSGTGIIEHIVGGLLDARASGEFDTVEFAEAIHSAGKVLKMLEDQGKALCELQPQNDVTSPHPNLLIVDDDPGVRRAVERMAIAIGYTVTCCAALHGVRCADTFPQVVVSDYDLPDGTGDEVQRYLDEVAAHWHVTAPLMIAHSSSLANLDKMRGTRVLKGNVEELDQALRSAYAAALGF